MKTYIGVEEEYFLVHKTRKTLLNEPPAELFKACSKAMAEISREYFQSQIEISSKRCNSIQMLRDEMFTARQKLCEILAPFDATIAACSTYPTAILRNQQVTPDPHYQFLEKEYAGVLRRGLRNGTHIHVNVDSKRQRISILNKLNCFLPILVALSSSSPFFDNCDTGLHSYRSLDLEKLPISGFPEHFKNLKHYKQVVHLYEKLGFIPNEHFIYWHARLGFKIPTIEVRAPDMCPKLEDTIALAALTQSLINTLATRSPKTLPFYTEEISFVRYYAWQTRRFSLKEAKFIDFSRNDAIPISDAIHQLLDFVSDTAKKLNCLNELYHINTILKEGTSADRQIKTYQETNDLNAVCKQIVMESSVSQLLY